MTEKLTVQLDELKAAFNTKERPVHKFKTESIGDSYLNNLGLTLLDAILCMKGRPVLLQGPTGMGKSTLARELARAVKLEYLALNAHPGTDMGFLAGFWRPTQLEGGGIGLVWQNGVVTEAVEKGCILLFEELSRAPQEAVSRLFGLLDDGFRYWPLPERGDDMAIHEDFWLIATSNPPREGYRTAEIDKALFSRFAGVFDLTKPIVDERRILLELIDDEGADAIQKLAQALRKSENTYVPTRDLVLLARAINGNLTPKDAIKYSLLPKLEKYRAEVNTAVADLPYWRK